MKDRYFGDFYDYVKYSIIRELAKAESASVVVCWMLTEDDGGGDGGRTEYLSQRETWRPFDPSVFDFLHRHVTRRVRNVRLVEKGGILPNCRFYSEILTDDRSQRRPYFDGLIKFAHGAPLVFFDPDNGIEVKSVKQGAKGSSKYLYVSEIERNVRAKHSVLVYQHLPPKPRELVIRRILGLLLRRSPSGVVVAFRTRKVAFFLVPQRGSLLRYRRATRVLEKSWKGVLKVSHHRRR